MGKALLGQDSIKIVEYFGHRGCRGLYPENSIEGFKHAISLGVDGIEWDVVVNKDKQLVISHDTYFDSKFCLNPDGTEINNEKKSNLYNLTQKEIELYECGLKIHPNFPEQVKLKTYKPLLQEVFQEIDLSDITILFEIKSKEKEDSISQPLPKEYVAIILKEIAFFEHKKNIIFMSFDSRILEELYRQAPEYRLVYLTYLPIKSVDDFLKDLSFNPYALGMLYPTIKKRKAKVLHKKGIKLIAWTVNDSRLSKKLVKKGIDGIITDYPNRVKR